MSIESQQQNNRLTNFFVCRQNERRGRLCLGLSGFRTSLVTCENFRFGVDRHPISAAVLPAKYGRTGIFGVEKQSLPSSKLLESQFFDDSGPGKSLVRLNFIFGVDRHLIIKLYSLLIYCYNSS